MRCGFVATIPAVRFALRTGAAFHGPA